MADYAPILAWIDTQQPRMEMLVSQWAAINSGSSNIAGLNRMAEVLMDVFAVLGQPVNRVALPPRQIVGADGRMAADPLGPVLSMKARPQLPLQVLLGIHFDTVYPADSPFQQVEKPTLQTLRGPGVADAKGGLAILLVALQALERSSVAVNIGWEVLLNPDEELGSPGSASLFLDAAKGKTLALLFEPALPDGSLVGARKGSGNFVFVVRGKAAHAGRDFSAGRSATVALSHIILAVNKLNDRQPDITVNIGRIEGGGALNIVPDLAIARVNIRCRLPQQQQEIRQQLDAIVRQADQLDGITVDLHGEFHAPPRILDDAHARWFNRAAECSRQLNMPVTRRESGGACDGNRLSAAGLPTIDTLGPVGTGIHSSAEQITISTLAQRAKLTALLLLKLAHGEFGIP